MSNKKRGKSPSGAKSTHQASAPAKGGRKQQYLIIGTVILVAFVAALAFAGNSAKKQASVPPEEQKYVGRFLPAAYAEAAVAKATTYESVVKMAPVVAASEASGSVIPLGDVVSNKIVSFDVQKDGKPLSMLAYVKPSGKLFVGVNFCPPCQGKGQRIDVDGTLTCEACGTKRNIETQIGISGACKLYPLDEIPVRVDGSNIVIAQSAIDGWSEQPLDRKVGE